MIATALPPYPSTRARTALSPSQLAILTAKIAHTLQDTLSLPTDRLSTPTTISFLASYARDAAHQALDTLLWDGSTPATSSTSRETRTVHARALQLAERLAPIGMLDILLLFDLSIAYTTHPKRLRALLSAAFLSSAPLLHELRNSAVHAFTAVLSPSTGLYSLRKFTHSLLCFLRVCPPEAIRVFAHSKDFHIALARTYDTGLAAVVQSYGGLRLPPNDARLERPLDEWERIFLETKVALIDTFHLLLKMLLLDLARAAGTARAAESEHVFGIVFALFDLPAPAPAPSSLPTPFLNRPLLVDFQHAYDLSRLFSDALSSTAADDARLGALVASLGIQNDSGRGPGALKLLLGSGVPAGIDARGNRRPTTNTTSFPGEIASSSGLGAGPSIDSVVDAQVSEVLSILPDHAPDYVRALFRRSEYSTVERVVEALLEGTAPPSEMLGATEPREEFEYTRDRRNVFDAEEIDLSRVHIGKKRCMAIFVSG